MHQLNVMHALCMLGLVLLAAPVMAAAEVAIGAAAAGEAAGEAGCNSLLPLVESGSSSSSSRQLQQDPASCPVEHCAGGCVYSQKAWRCSKCADGYARAQKGQACVCQPGKKVVSSGCAACPFNYYCMNGVATRCPGLLLTAQRGARDLQDCVNPPGYYYVPATVPTARPCGLNEYSVGLKKQATCTPCPAGTITDPKLPLGQQTSSSVCKAGPGYMLMAGNIVACPVGTFKDSYTDLEAPCVSCLAVRGPGLTTTSSGSSSETDCAYVEPGYAAVDARNTVIMSLLAISREAIASARPCPQGYYCSGGYLALPTKCPTGLLTRAEGAYSVKQCVAPPGWRYDSVSAAGVECENGHYSTGYDNIGSCAACGENAATSEDPADLTVGWKSSRSVAVLVKDPNTGRNTTWAMVRGGMSSCFLRRGLAALKVTAGLQTVLRAIPCPSGNYGSNVELRLGVSTSFACQTCPMNMVTSCENITDPAPCLARLAPYAIPYSTGTAYSSAMACVHRPGYGWLNVAGYGFFSLPCPAGYFSVGGHNDTCTRCPWGLFSQVEGAVDADSCSPPPGYTWDNNLKTGVPCTDGYYKPGWTRDPCSKCGLEPASLSGLWKSEENFLVAVYNPTTGTNSTLSTRGSADSCYLRAGLGTVTVGLMYQALSCNNNTYSAITGSSVYGIAPSPCLDCPSSMVTSCDGVTDATVAASCAADLSAYSAATGGYTSSRVCKHLPGYGWVGAVSRTCLAGTYSPGGHNSTCTLCPIAGTDFVPTVEGATTVDDCYLLSPGYAATTLLGVVILTAVTDYTQVGGTTPCPVNYYCPGGSPASSGVPQPCLNGLVTNSTGASSAELCAASAGYTYDAGTNSPVPCADGYYKDKIGREACTACGLLPVPSGQWRSNTVRSSSSKCYLTQGLGSAVEGSALRAQVCSSNNYSSIISVGSPSYGISAAVPCLACPTNTYTSCDNVTVDSYKTACLATFTTYTSAVTGGYYDSRVCKTLPGYGTYTGSVTLCPANTWGPGGLAFGDACVACPTVSGVGFNPTVTGSTTTVDCYNLDVGYAAKDFSNNAYTVAVTNSSGINGATLCPKNYYCTGGSPGSAGVPKPCPNNLETSSTGSRNETYCAAGPGYFYDAATNSGIECYDGQYKGTTDRNPCTDCGLTPYYSGGWWKSVSLRTNTSTCYLLPGLGTVTEGSSLRAVVCNNNNYSSITVAAGAKYGVASTPCLPCSTNMVTSCSTVTDATALSSCQSTLLTYNTSTGGYYSIAACVHRAGYGWVSGASQPCLADLLPGYAAVNTSGGIIYTGITDYAVIYNTTLCPKNYYCPGGRVSAVGVGAGAGLPVACSNNLQTSATGKMAETDCMAPPGYFYTSTNNGTAVECYDGYYQSGYTRSTTCTKCGTNPKADGGLWRSTSLRDATSKCYVEAGAGVSGGVASACNNNHTYSAGSTYPGTACSTCPTNTYTTCETGIKDNTTLLSCRSRLASVLSSSTGGYTNITACAQAPGYGWDGTSVSTCQYTRCEYSWGGATYTTACQNCIAYYQALGYSGNFVCPSDNNVGPGCPTPTPPTLLDSTDVCLCSLQCTPNKLPQCPPGLK